MSLTITIPTLETERLRLRAPDAADFAAYGALLMSDRARYVGGPFSRGGAWRDFAAEAAGWVLNGFGGWGVDIRESNVFIGNVIIQKPPYYPEAELGWVLLAEHEGRGYAYEAAKAARAWAYDSAGIPSLVSYIDPENTRSIALAERLGARHDPTANPPGGEGCLIYRHPQPEHI